MDMNAFTDSLREHAPPPGLAPALQALWYQANGDWHKAHALAQSQHDDAGSWVHAFLHRAEGDDGNADYWYRRSGKPRSNAPMAQEWREIVTALL